jgi:hypothetical protein
VAWVTLTRDLDHLCVDSGATSDLFQS